MTRGNISIVSPAQGLTFSYYYQHDAHPDDVISMLKRYDGHPESLEDLVPGHISNFDYWYELDINSDGPIKVWGYCLYWKSDPNTIRGWKTATRKGKRLPNTQRCGVSRMLLPIYPNQRYTKEQLKQAPFLQHEMKKLKYHPDYIHTWLKPIKEYYDLMYVLPLENMPCLINSKIELEKTISTWRLKINT